MICLPPRVNLRTLQVAFTLALLPLPMFADKELDALRAKAEGGDARAQCELGKCLPFNDAPESAKWFLKSAEQGDAEAQYFLGRWYCSGQGVPKDSTKAVEWYRKSAEQGNADAQYELDQMLFMHNNRGDYAEALGWYIKSTEGGSTLAVLPIGEIYYFGLGVPTDPVKAAKWWRNVAGETSELACEAKILLGLLYQSGEGVEKDYAKALELYKKAAVYLDNCDNRKKKEWMEWYSDVVKLGDTDQCLSYVQLKISQAYDCGGFFFARNRGQNGTSRRWLVKAADRGYGPAEYELGNAYAYVEPIDITESLKWYRKAAVQGHKVAQLDLGNIYSLGDGVPRNYTQALQWYRKAAEQGVAYAQKQISWMYYLGQGVPKEDNVLSYVWVNIFLTQDIRGFKKSGIGYRYLDDSEVYKITGEDRKGARKLREDLEGQMTPAQIAKAQELSSTYAALIKDGKPLPAE